MKILLLTQYFTPEPAGKLADLARELNKRGHEVQVLTGFPCYPFGKIYAGYRQSIQGKEQIDGNIVIRVPQIPDHSRSVVKRIMYYCSFAISAIILGLFRAKRPDVVLVYQSALPTGIAAWMLSRLWRVPYVIDLADLWPESVAASGMLQNRVVHSLIRRVAKFVYDGAAEINVITEGYRANLQHLGVDHAKINLVRWWSEEGVFEPVERDELFAAKEDFSGKFNIVYAGTIGPCQQLETILDAAERLRDLPDVQFTIAGDGVARSELREIAREEKLDNVRFIGRRDPKDISKMFALSELLLVHLKPDNMSEISIPSKTVDYLCSGRPLLMAVAGEASRLVQEHGCGVTVPPSDSVQLAVAIRNFYSLSKENREQYARAARNTFLQHFSREEQIDRLENSLKRAVAEQHRYSFYRRYGKRLLDLAVALPMLIALSPILVMTAFAIRFSLGTPVLFKQSRPGRGGHLFDMYKFRTMREAYDNQGNPLPDGERMARFGRWLRETSVDELPELWNVVRGEMSLVGPRPLLPAYLQLYTPEQARRHTVKPGLTGLAQVAGRNSLGWEEKFQLDVEYVDNHSLWQDLGILWQTVVKVLHRSGVNAQGHATMPEFRGTEAIPQISKRRAA